MTPLRRSSDVRRFLRLPRRSGFALLLLAAAAIRTPAAEPPRPETAAPAGPESEPISLSDEEQKAVFPDRNSTLARQLEAAQTRRTAATTPRDQLRADLALASLHQQRGAYRELLALARDGEARARALSLADLQVSFLVNLALAYGGLTDRPAAVEYAELAAEGLAALPAAPAPSARHLEIGLAFMRGGRPDLAGEHYRKDLALMEAAGRWTEAATARLNLASIELAAGRHDAAWALYEGALATHARGSPSPDTPLVANVLINQGLILLARKDPADAEPLLRRAAALHRAHGAQHHLAHAQLTLARALRELDRLDEALVELRAGYAIARAVDSARLSYDYHLAFVRLWEKRGQYRSALTAQRNAAIARERMVNETTRARLDDLRVRHDLARRERELDTLRRERGAQAAVLAAERTRLAGLGALLLAGAVVAGAVIWRQRLVLATNRRILAESESARLAAEDADRLKTRFLGAAAHDIKSPLANVTHLVDRVRAESAGNDAVCRQLDLIQGQVRRVLGHTRDFLDGAALEQGRLALFPAPMDLADVARAVIAEQRWHAEARRQTLVLAPAADGAGAIHGDFDRLHQVVANLVNNAIKFSPPGAATRLSLERTPTAVRLAVADEGPGLTAEALARLYTPFTRLGTPSDAGEPSHGLGLSIAQEIARLHGGRIAAHSTAGRGATFVLELPLPA